MVRLVRPRAAGAEDGHAAQSALSQRRQEAAQLETLQLPTCRGLKFHEGRVWTHDVSIIASYPRSRRTLEDRGRYGEMRRLKCMLCHLLKTPEPRLYLLTRKMPAACKAQVIGSGYLWLTARLRVRVG